MRALAFTRAVVTSFNRYDGSTMAAAIAYYALLSVFPIILGLLSVLGFLLGDPARAQQLTVDIASQFPGSSQLIQDIVRDVAGNAQAAGLVATVGFIFVGSGFFQVIGVAFDRIWGVLERPSFVKNAVLAVGLVLSVGLIFLVSLAVSTGLGLASNVFVPALGVRVRDFPLISLIAGLIVPYLVAFALFTGIYWVVPNRILTWHDVWPGALFASIVFEIAKQVFAWYLTTIAHLDLVYGSIAAVIALVTWSYLSGIVLLIGAHVNVVLSSRRTNAIRTGAPPTEERRQDAA